MTKPLPALLQAMDERVLIFDGAMGTSVHALDLPLSEYRGLENCTEILTLTRPDCIEQIHRDFLEVGCDAVETNTFGASRIVLTEFGLEDQTYELNVASAQIARRACDAYSTPQQRRFVIGSVGPGTKLISLRQTDYPTMLASYFEQMRGLIDGGVDAILIETCQDILQSKVAIEAARRAFDQAGRKLPLMVQVTMETTGAMLVGTDIAAAATALEAYPEVDVIGLNCATGPQEMSEHIRYLAQNSSRPLSVLPNAGLPQLVAGKTHFPLSPAELARWLREFVSTDGVSVVGGCCGTTPEHLKAVVQAVAASGVQRAQRQVRSEPACSSLYGATPYRQDNSFLIIGERCNTNGSKKFKQLLAGGDTDGCVAMAQEQVRDEGAHVIDVCVDYVGRDGVPDMRAVISRFSSEVTAPLMLDSTQLDVLAAGLELSGGKCIINSVNLEEGEEKLDRVARLARQHGAALVALTIDEDPIEAMGKTSERKLAIATRIHDLLTNRHRIAPEDIFFDCLTFPITTGAESDRRLALETLDGIERVMERFPRSQSVLGLSNVSFGLQPLARVVLNSVFLFEARKRGLTAAIVHAGKILPRTQISDERWDAALDLIYDRQEKAPDPLGRFISLFTEGESVATKVRLSDLPIEERLRRRIVDGQRVGLEADLDEARQKYAPLDIINNILLDGMKTVGELFGAGQMQLPFVLKSAEAMKSAVAFLEPFMEKSAGDSRGRIVLATVRGDVHDIGKNLVDIILTNNGYTVYNLGIKQPIGNVITALREYNADAIGLSGLLVKSTLVMRDDLLVLNEQQLSPPVILGGAALTRAYVEEELRPLYQGPLYYAKDAFEGLELMGRISASRQAREPVAAAVGSSRNGRASSAAPDDVAGRSAAQLAEEAEQRFGVRDVGDDDDSAPPSSPAVTASPIRTSSPTPLDYASPVPRPPFWGARVVEHIELRAALGYLNETMLFQVQWGFRKKGRNPEDWKKFVDAEIRPIYRELVARCERERILQPAAVYGYWPASSDGNDLILYDPSEVVSADGSHPSAGHTDSRLLLRHPAEIARFTFPRQSKPPHRCLADFWRPRSEGQVDVVALHIVTAGARVSEVARDWFAANDYQQYLFLHGLGVETAEALAEMMHRQIRIELGVAEHDARDRQALFKQGYQGARYSFGYPACPRLEDQATLMQLLQPERIGITLSEEFQLEPEQSTSAIITYHPAARYFAVN